MLSVCCLFLYYKLLVRSSFSILLGTYIDVVCKMSCVACVCVYRSSFMEYLVLTVALKHKGYVISGGVICT